MCEGGGNRLSWWHHGKNKGQDSSILSGQDISYFPRTQVDNCMEDVIDPSHLSIPQWNNDLS